MFYATGRRRIHQPAVANVRNTRVAGSGTAAFDDATLAAPLTAQSSRHSAYPFDDPSVLRQITKSAELTIPFWNGRSRLIDRESDSGSLDITSRSTLLPGRNL